MNICVVFPRFYEVYYANYTKIHRLSIMHHIVALYHRKNMRFYSEDDGAECILSCITLCLRWEMNLLRSITQRFKYRAYPLHTIHSYWSIVSSESTVKILTTC